VWSPPIRIPIVLTDSNQDFLIQGMAVDPNSTAHIGVAFYFYPNWQCGGQSNPCRLYAGFVSSTDGGVNWKRQTVFGAISPIWLADSPDGCQSCHSWMIGDYISASFVSNGKAYPAYPIATRPGDGDCTYGLYPNDLECREYMVAPTNGLSVG